MNYKRFTNEELSKCKYPNLIAEFIESGYSISTLADHMGLGAKKNGVYRTEDDKEVWDELNGIKEMPASHCIGLCGLFGVDLKYLFSSELQVESEKPLAYWRWFEENKKKEEFLKNRKRERNILSKMAALDDLVLEFYEINSLLEMTKTAVSDGCSDMDPDALSKALHRLHRDLTSTICKLIEVCAGKGA